jgi:hypothetical protein
MPSRWLSRRPLKKIPYKPSRLGPGGLALFDERPIATLSIAIEEVNGQLSLIGASPRGSAGDILDRRKRKLRSFVAQHLSRNAKVMADEVQGVRVFGSEDETQTIEHEGGREAGDPPVDARGHVGVPPRGRAHRQRARRGRSTSLLDVYTAFGVTQTVAGLPLHHIDDSTSGRSV